MWDEKSNDLAKLADRYFGTLEEQKKMFIKMKLIMQDKDQLIKDLQR